MPKKPTVPPPPDPMQAFGKASTIGAPQGPYTPLTSGADAPLVRLAHSVFGDAQREPGGAYAMTQGNLMGLVGGGDTPAAAGVASTPIARFMGWMRGAPEKGIDHVPLYNVEAPGHPLDRSTVSPQTLHAHGIPFTPPPPPRWEEQMVTTGQGMQVPASFFNQPQGPAGPTFTAKTGAEPGIAKTYAPDLPSLLGKQGRPAAMGANVVPIRSDLPLGERTGPLRQGSPQTSESVAAAKAARDKELEGVAQLKEGQRVKGARAGFKAVKGGKKAEE